MANGSGIAVINFGNWPGSNEASIVVTGQSAISATSKAESFIMGDDFTADKNAEDHRYAASFLGLTCGTPTAATGFTIYARSPEKIEGTYKLRYVWAD
jgi:hypothetical protein